MEGAATGGGGLGGPSSVDSKQQENTLIKESGVVALALLEDQRQELADLRRQVVYLQVFARSIFLFIFDYISIF